MNRFQTLLSISTCAPTTWHEYGSPAINVSAALGADAVAGLFGATFLFGDLSYATG